MNKKREQWGSRAGFILAAIGSAVGLGNIWRFPYVATSNGGGAFLIPYLFALLTAGIPILILEFAVANKIKKSTSGVFGEINPKYKVFGWIQTMTSFVIMTYYVVILAWSINYLGFSLSAKWGMDHKGFFFGDFLHLTNGPFEFGRINWAVVITLLFVWLVNFIVLRNGIKSGIEKANKVFMPLLIVSLAIIVIRGVTLEGALQGINYFFEPDFSKLTSPEVWLAAYGQIFFSLSICYGIMITFASYLPDKTDIVNNAFITGLGNCSFSIFAGIGVFSVLGYMAFQQGVSVSEVASGGVGLAFVVFPMVIDSLPGFNSVFGVIFFASLLFAGLSSSISVMEVVNTSIIEKFDLPRKKVVAITAGLGFIVSLIYTSGAGLYILDIIDHYVNIYAITGSGLIEIILFAWLFNIKDLRKFANDQSDFRIGKWWEYTLKFLTPAVLIVLLATNTYKDFTAYYEGYPGSAQLVFGVGSLLFIVLTSVGFTKYRKRTKQADSKGVVTNES